MSQAKSNIFEMHGNVDTVTKAASYTMTPKDELVRVNATAANITITLPSVAECVGRFYSIVIVVGAEDVAIACPNDDALNYLAVEALVPTAVGDMVLLYSDGVVWQIVNTVIGGTRN